MTEFVFYPESRLSPTSNYHQYDPKVSSRCPLCGHWAKRMSRHFWRYHPGESIARP